MNDAVDRLPDPSARIERAYRAVLAQRMQGLDFVNAALAVECVAFAPWQGHWLGVVITPWSINLALAPRDPAAWQPIERLVKRRYQFPAGEYEFIGASDEDLGELQICSLFSPVLEFEDQETARMVAVLAREALLDPVNAQGGEDLSRPALTPQKPGPVAELAGNLDKPMSRRDVLRARFLPHSDDDRR